MALVEHLAYRAADDSQADDHRRNAAKPESDQRAAIRIETRGSKPKREHNGGHRNGENWSERPMAEPVGMTLLLDAVDRRRLTRTHAPSSIDGGHRQNQAAGDRVRENAAECKDNAKQAPEQTAGDPLRIAAVAPRYDCEDLEQQPGERINGLEAEQQIHSFPPFRRSCQSNSANCAAPRTIESAAIGIANRTSRQTLISIPSPVSTE